jgi:hypothetical protein
MRRWLLIIFILVLTLLAASAIAVQVIFTTDLPRRLVIDALEDQTGLRFGATSLETGWGGSTILRDLTIALPLETDPFVSIPTLSLTHTDLIRLVVFRDPILNTARVQRPHVALRQDAQGRWNVLEAAEIVEQRFAARGTQTGEVPPLPKLDVVEARIEITDITGCRAEYGPLKLRGEPVDALSWDFAVSLHDDVIARGQLAPRARWSHRIDFDFQDIQQLVAPWMDEVPPVLQAAGTWRGQVNEASLNGTLRLSPLRADDLTVRGEVSVNVRGPAVTLRPSNLVAAFDDPDLPAVHVQSGSLVADVASESVRVDRLLVQTLGLAVHLDGGWASADDAAWADVRWSGTLEHLATHHEGSASVRLELPRVGWQVATATIQSHGAQSELQWDSRWEVLARGEDWRSLSGSIRSPQLTLFTGQDTIDLGGVGARFTANWPIIQLTHLDLPGAVTRGQGAYDADTGTWSLQLAAQQWKIPGLHLAPYDRDDLQDLAVDVHLQAAGTKQYVNLDALRVVSLGTSAIPAFEVSAGGRYDFQHSQPLTLRAIARSALSQEGVQARLHADVIVAGEVQPLSLQVEGDLHASEVSWNGQPLEDLALPLRGVVNADLATFESAAFPLLDGWWQLQARYDARANFAEARLNGQGASVGRIVRFIDAPLDLSGTFAADVQLQLPQLNVDAVQVQGDWELNDLQGEGLHAATGRGRIDYFDNRVRLEDLQLAQNGGQMTGRAEFDLRHVEQVTADVRVNGWRVSLPEYGLDARLDGSASLGIDLVKRLAAPGSAIAMRVDLTMDHEPLGELDVQAALDGRSAAVEHMVLTGLGGRAEGRGVIELTDVGWYASTLDLVWHGIDLSRVPLRMELEHELVGAATGSLHIAPAEDPRAPEPMQVDLVYELTDAAYGPFSLGDGQVTGFLGTRRFMIQQSRFDVLDGTIELWGRMTEHERQPFTHLHLQLQEIDLQQIADFIGYTEYPMPGRIHGAGIAGGYLREPHRLFGQANLRLTDSDIVSMPGIAQLYSAANIDFRRPEPRGVGEVLVRLENESIDIARLTYFNRGMDIVARARVMNLWEGGDSPISGIAAGTVRPLRDTRLPFVGDNLDRLLSALQADAISVRINGTVNDSRTSVVPLSEVTGALSRILRGRVD